MPTLHTTTDRASKLGLSAAALVLLSGALLTGCSDSDDLEGVQEGRDALVRLTSSGPAETRERLFTDASSAVTGADGDGAVAAAGSIVKGVSGAGLAQLAMEEFASNAAELGNRVRLLRDLSLGYTRADVTLDELSRYDVDRGIAELSARVQEHRSERESAAASLATLERELEGVRSTVSGLQTEATELRAQESSLRDQALRLDVVARADVIRQANVLRRQADGVEKEIDSLSFDIASLERRIALAESAVASADRLISINERSEQRMRSRAQDLAREASRVRSERDAQRAELTELAQDIATFLDGPFADSLDQTTSAYESAARDASRGRGAGSQQSAGANAVVQRGLATAHLFAATSYESAAEVASRMAALGVQSPLDAANLESQAEEHRAAAGVAYESYAAAAQTAARGERDIDGSIESIEAFARTLQGIEDVEEPTPDMTAEDEPVESDPDEG